MQYALVGNVRMEATPGAQGICPQCAAIVVARCGEINIHHWAHKSHVECDSWGEGEGQWHLAWKRRFPKQWREVAIQNHRADIKSPRGVVELQASSISSSELTERENFYGSMVWIVDASRFNIRITDHGNFVNFRWKHPRKTWLFASRPLFFDLGTELLEVRKIHEGARCAGWGKLLSYKAFVDKYSQPLVGHALCEACRMSFPMKELVKTGMYEFYTMDVDPLTLICLECYEAHRESCIPDDPDLFDCYTPVEIG